MDEGFVRDLRQALNHLYDPHFLGRSPLCAALGITTAYDRPVRLQRLLEDGITALRPATREAANAHQGHLYELLAYRYLQQFGQKEVADQLNISLSQLAREQNAALQALALYLWDRHHPTVEPAKERQAAASGDQPHRQPAGEADELAWLAVPSPDRVAHVQPVLRDVVNMVQPLLLREQTTLKVHAQDALPALAVYPAALRQILLNLLTVFLHLAQGGRITVSAALREYDIVFEITGERQTPGVDHDTYDPAPSLQTARHMAELSGGTLVLDVVRSAATARLVLPTLESMPVLVVDDSADHVELLKRYAAHTSYRVLSTQDPQRATELAEQTGARAIVIDIMMPRCDGWTVLERLRAHPATAHLPILVCSIIPCSELVLPLGANAFLQKPVSREDFLATLAHWLDPRAPAPR